MWLWSVVRCLVSWLLVSGACGVPCVLVLRHRSQLALCGYGLCGLWGLWVVSSRRRRSVRVPYDGLCWRMEVLPAMGTVPYRAYRVLAVAEQAGADACGAGVRAQAPRCTRTRLSKALVQRTNRRTSLVDHGGHRCSAEDFLLAGQSMLVCCHACTGGRGALHCCVCLGVPLPSRVRPPGHLLVGRS